MKKSVCLIFVFFTFINLFSKPNEELLKTVRKSTVYEDEIIGIEHRESKVYKAAQEYMSACSDKEIMELLNDENIIRDEFSKSLIAIFIVGFVSAVDDVFGVNFVIMIFFFS